jgi:hypothetical protein
LLTSAKVAERIGRALGYPGSASTLLRCAHRYEPPRVLACEVGVDDFAFRRGRRYGTIIIDLATHRPIELLRERSVTSLTAYLEAHPEVRVVARDRDARYAEAIALAAPDATVVVDRWHLLRNLTEAFERLVANRSGAWRATLQAHVDAQHDNATEGLPLGHWLYPGKQSDVKSMAEASREFRDRLGLGSFVVVADRGMVSRRQPRKRCRTRASST